MKILLLGLGFVGAHTAQLLKADGHILTGTTTTPAKVEALRAVCDDVMVLTSDEAETIWALGENADAIINTIGPNVRRASDPAARDEEYRRTLALACQNAAAANPRCIFTSSLSVYGDGGVGAGPITETTPLSHSQHPSPRYYQQAENFILAGGRGAVVRLPDVYGAPTDLSYIERVKLGHTLMGGRVPFAPEALLYRIHVLDAARAMFHILENNLTGVYNAVDNRARPPANQTLFDRLADEAGVGRLEFTSAIRLPAREISGQKLTDTGFCFAHTDYEYR